MSLCRFSSDNWKCDLYIYYDCAGGITIHVAENRHKGDIPELPDLLKVREEGFAKAHKIQMDYLQGVELVPIGLKEDGETFNVLSIKEFHKKLTHLRELGYNFPDYLFDIDEEPDL